MLKITLWILTVRFESHNFKEVESNSTMTLRSSFLPYYVSGWLEWDFDPLEHCPLPVEKINKSEVFATQLSRASQPVVASVVH